MEEESYRWISELTPAARRLMLLKRLQEAGGTERIEKITPPPPGTARSFALEGYVRQLKIEEKVGSYLRRE